MGSEDWPVSVKERIEAQLRLDLIQGTGVGEANVQRYDEGGNTPAIPGDGAGAGVPPEVMILVAFSDEDEDDAGQDTAAGFETVTLPFTIDIHLRVMPAGYRSTAQWANAWLARVKRAVMANPRSVEGGGSGGGELAMDTYVDGTAPPLATKDQRTQFTSVDGRKLYRHPVGDPYTPG